MMDYQENAEEAAFRQGLREWLKSNIPANWRELKTVEEERSLRKNWHEALYKSGYVGLNWPVEYGGKNLSPSYEAILHDEVGNVDAPHLPANVNFLGRALLNYGTEEQKRTHLAKMLSGEIQWCQGFSEPGAGSDLAALRTSAERVGDHYIVNGQKMWTSGATTSDWCMLLVRTDTSCAKHKGISCILTPMDVPGLEVRPIRLTTGDEETCELFLTDLKVPVENRIGEEGDGWRLAMTTVAYERGAADVGLLSMLRRQYREIEAIAVERGLHRDVGVRRRLARSYVDIEALARNAAQQLSSRLSGAPPGPEGSIGKLLWSHAAQQLMHLALDVCEADALTGRAPEWLYDYFTSRPMSVYGGSSEIQKNILARMMDMPR